MPKTKRNGFINFQITERPGIQLGLLTNRNIALYALENVLEDELVRSHDCVNIKQYNTIFKTF